MRLPLLSPLHQIALTDSQTWRDNPFVNRERRRDVKRRQPTKQFAWMAGVMLTLGGLGFWGLWALMRSRFHIPWFLGGDLSTALCILIVGLHAPFIAGAAQNRATLLLAQEAHRDTLSSLLLLPMSPFQLLLQTGVYPWLAGMRTAFVLLPLYVFCVALEGISWLDLIMLYVVFAMISVAFPVWRRPMLSETALVVAPTQAGAGANTAMAQTAMGTSPQTTGGAAPATTNAGATGSGGWVSLIFTLPMLLTFFAFIGGRGSLANVQDMLSPYFPDSLLRIMLPSLLSWPLLIARGLITPLDWFGWHLPPLLFVLPFFCIHRYLLLVRTSEFLSVGTFRDLAGQPTYISRRLVEGGVRIAQLFVTTGYLWIWLVGHNALGFLVQIEGKVVQPAGGLVGFVYALLFATIVRGLFRANQLAAWQRGVKAARLAVRSIPLKSALRYLAEPFVFFFLFTTVCALMARVNPLTPFIVTLAGRMLAIGLAGILLNYGATRLMGSWSLLVALAVMISWVVLISGYQFRLVQPLEYFSATLGLLYLTHAPWAQIGGLFEQGVQWWRWPLECGSVGLILTLTAVAMRIHLSAVLPENVTPVTLDPTRVGEETFSDPPLTLKGERPKLSDTPIALRLIALIQRIWDNAILTKELRVRLRGKLEFSSVRAIFLVLIVVTLTCYQGLPAIPELFGGAMSQGLFGQDTVGGAILCCFYIALLIRGMFGGFVTFQAFMVERDKSTLGFVLMTPMSALSIVMGKVAGILMPASLFMGTLGLWTLVLSVLNIPTLGPITLAVWLGMMATSFTLLITFGMLTLAVVSIFPKIPTQYASCIWIALFQVMLQSMIHLGRYVGWVVRLLNQDFGLNGPALWGIGLLCAAILTLISLLLAVFGVLRMRSKDLTFAASKRDN